eukprot:UN34840
MIFIYFYTILGFAGALVPLCVFVFEISNNIYDYTRALYVYHNKELADKILFNGFYGAMIYGHGNVQHINPLFNNLFMLFCDYFFIIICDKLMLLLACDDDQRLIYAQEITCWEDNHQFIAVISLILLGYYIPLSTLIAPMFSLDAETTEIVEIKPYKSFLILSKAFLLLTC